jgi:biotin transport system substrate-specific component
MDQVKSNVLVSGLEKIAGSALFWILSFAFLTALSAQIIVPIKPVPVTMQTLIVLLAGAFLGSKNGMASQFTYLAAGVIGIPVFAGLSFGIPTLLGPTGGYLISFPVAAFVVGYFTERNNGPVAVALSMVLATLIIHLLGATYLSLFFNGNFIDTLFAEVLIFSVWDIIKIAAAVSIYFVISKKYPKVPH